MNKAVLEVAKSLMEIARQMKIKNQMNHINNCGESSFYEKKSQNIVKDLSKELGEF